MRFLAALLMMVTIPAMAASDVPLDQLTKGQQIQGFRVEAVYLNDANQPMGARFIHEKSGFTLDLLQIESVPQGYTWVNSIPVSEQGEPHTQEHLLLAKGTTGRAFASLDTMWLSGSTAFTQQWRTSYPFNTAAGPDVFFNIFAAQLNAMLNPNYTDEEIRREVRSFGVTENPDGTLRLEEKGSVYNEMVSSMTQPNRIVFRQMSQLVYGSGHPLAMNSGGEPSGIRTMQPRHIREFHRNTYYLGNIGTIASFPKSVPVSEILERAGAILEKAQGNTPLRKAQSLDDIPAKRPASPGTISIVEYPHRNEQQPSPIALVFPADRNLDANEQSLADLFMSAFAGDATTNVYKLFIDSKTRKLDIGAKTVFSFVNDDAGNPITIFFTDVTTPNLTNDKLAAVRQIVVDEIRRIASFPDGSPELKEFNERIASRLTQANRTLARFVNSPPGFGARGGGSQWLDHISLLEKTPEFRKSVTLKPQIAFVEGLLASDKNFWRDYLTKWKLVGTEPYVAAARPSPTLLQRDEAERVARANAEAMRLAQLYTTTDIQDALRRYRADQDAEAARIEAAAKDIKPPDFVQSPPMTLDDQLQYETRTVAGVPLVASHFDNMTSATTGIALRLDTVPREQLRYISLLPALLTMTGVIENGRPISYEEMSERMRREILSLDAIISSNPRTERIELVLRGAGIGPAEARRALDWMTLALHSPDWRTENLPRIRDVVDQSLSQLRNTMAGSEESWVNNPADAYRVQHNPAYLAAGSFLTRTHNALRLRWLLREAAASDVAPLRSVFAQLANARGKSREDLKKSPDVSALSPDARAIVTEVMKDLEVTLNEIPDSNLESDWAYVVNAIRDDLFTPPSQALANLDAVRKRILTSGGARMFTVGSSAMDRALAPSITGFLSRLTKSAAPAVAYDKTRHVDARLLARDSAAKNPVYVGLVAPNMRGGVVNTSVPGVHFSDAGDKEKQLDFLASRLYAAYGAHGIFLKTLAAGLAYSNGLRGSVSSGRVGYYAERTPELPQTVRFVVNELKNAPRNTTLGDYTVAQVFGEFRSASNYETRAEGIAADLADKQPPDQVRRFRESILELRKDPDLGTKLFDRKDRVYARMVPGYAAGVEVPDGIFYTVGPDKQLDAWAEYLKATEGADTKLYKLYPRDYWMP